MNEMDTQTVIRLKPVVKVLKALNPQYSTCCVCGLPWNCCEHKTIKVSKSTGIFAVCTYCWNNSTLADLKTYYGQLWQEHRQISGNSLNYSLLDVLDAVEEEYKRTNNIQKLPEISDSKIKEDNELIAKFLGWFQEDDREDTWFVKTDFAIHVAYSTINNYPYKDLPFHRDWNYLMKVVETIESIDEWVLDIYGKNCEVEFGDNFTIDDITFKGDTKRQAVWLACGAFIKWYNHYNKTQHDET